MNRDLTHADVRVQYKAAYDSWLLCADGEGDGEEVIKDDMFYIEDDVLYVEPSTPTNVYSWNGFSWVQCE